MCEFASGRGIDSRCAALALGAGTFGTRWDYIDLLWVHFPNFVTPLDELCAGTDDLARADTLLAVADEIGLPAAQVAVAWLLERGRQSTTALVPVIGPRTVEQVDSYIASLDVRIDEEQY